MVCWTFVGIALHLPPTNIQIFEAVHTSWNDHPLRTACHKSPLPLFTAGVLLLQNSGLEAMDFFQAVDETYGIDTDGPIPPGSGTFCY